jgi:hypothetical protein
MSGPQQERLRSMLQGANKQMIQAAYQEWRAGSELLLAVSTTLHGAAPRIQDQFGRTGPAAARAFGKVAGKVAERSSQMSAAGDALVAALDVIAEAERLRDRFDAAPLAEPTRPAPSPGPSTPEDVAAKKQYDSRKAGYDAAHADREAQAAAAADRMDLVFADSTETMKRIHGEPDPTPQHHQADGPGATGSTGSSSTGTGSSTGYHPSSGGHQTHLTTTATHTGQPPTTSTPHAPSSGTSPLPPGTAQGGNEPFQAGAGSTSSVPVGGVRTGGAASTGLTVPTAGGLAGALGGGALGGMTGISGAVRGSTAVPTGSASGGRVAGATGGRAIGSAARTGATSGTLGRSTTGGTGGTGGTARGAATGTQRGAGTRSDASRRTGSRGAPGGRGTGGATGARGGRSKKDPRKKGTDFVVEEQDWVEDEGAAPGVID